MNSRKIWLFAVCAALAVGIMGAQQKSNVPVSPQKRPVIRKCADVVVESFTVALVSTQVGTPGIEFPTDTVRLRAVLKSAGSLPLSPGNHSELLLYRNNETLKVLTLQGIIGPIGSTWIWENTDTFTHGTPAMYLVWVNQFGDPECSLTNNGLRLTINETLLHPAN